MVGFPFSDLHSFKDYVGFVKLCAPNLFPERYALPSHCQWTLELAFEGLDAGLILSRGEKVPSSVVESCKVLFEEAKSAYVSNDIKSGYSKLDEAHRLLKEIPTQ